MQNSLSLLKTIREDYQAHGSDWTKPGFQALAVHRFGRWTRTIETRALRMPFSLAAKMGFVFTRNFYGIELPVEATIGRRVVFEHQHGIVVHGNAVIGDDCILRQGCTLGMKSVDKPHEAPRLGNNVNVGAGSKILGGISIGNHCTVGANSVVTQTVPSGVRVVGHNKWLDFDIQACSSCNMDLHSDVKAAEVLSTFVMNKYGVSQRNSS